MVSDIKRGTRLMVFENRMMKRIRVFRLNRDQMRVGWRKLHNEELDNFYNLSIIRMMKSRRMRWTGRVV
jgi:hypothetical protein